MSRGFCVDASVGAKWFFGDEELGAKAKKLAEGFLTGHHDLVVPDLFFYELDNVLTVAARSGRVGAEWAMEALDTLAGMELPTVAAHEHLDSAFALSLRFGISLYDAAYLVAAEGHGYLFVTADQRLHSAVRDELPYVTLLSEVEA